MRGPRLPGAPGLEDRRGPEVPHPKELKAGPPTGAALVCPCPWPPWPQPPKGGSRPGVRRRTHRGTVFGLQKERTSSTCCHMDGPGTRRAGHSEPDTEWSELYDSIDEKPLQPAHSERKWISHPERAGRGRVSDWSDGEAVQTVVGMRHNSGTSPTLRVARPHARARGTPQVCATALKRE